MTLIELLIVMTMLAIMTAVVGFAWRPDGWTAARWDDAGGAGSVTRARQQALASGRRVSAVVQIGDSAVALTALPDGRVIGAERFGLDPLSGGPASFAMEVP